jgi:hypothetical protein
MNVGHISSSSMLPWCSNTPDLSRLKALGRPEGELPFDVRVVLLALGARRGDNVSQIIAEVLLALVLGIVGANFGENSELKDLSWRTEMRKRYSPYDSVYNQCPNVRYRPIEQMINPSLTFPEFKKTDTKK